MAQENISQEFRVKNIDNTRNFLIEEINRNELMSKNLKKFCTTLSYIEYIVILASSITVCISISAFTSLIGIYRDYEFCNKIKNLCNSCRN